ncbi:cyclase family protein [Desulfosporosinus sp. BICA1-9]|uniref:cyclase family protein n=1 Tax=Desulfosporosinus sp. BICA1-9 TaxID=1531958 RepID=UPI00054B7F06|nr:cyclase family protein [Desulfosporosinus sp. BICA1-9]KJS50829.1 MAG: hypothetical protein VR66_00635 [Peptococcaceae bacterium BRH_c23]KJS83447.1 MAG: hypothetical protein JL57_22710 [Desulfosporosinus sp. BICA1-9]HBW37377.1 cyclase family protein [Desulfosporosinus sp.]
MSKATADFFEGLPDNWGRWGDNDEVGGLNFLSDSEILRGVKAVESGRTFTLMMALNSPGKAPNWPGREKELHRMCRDKSHYLSGAVIAGKGGVEYADDIITVNCHGTTHCDALAHTWLADKAWNGYNAAANSIGGIKKASIRPIAERGIVGHVVLLDIARYKKVPYLKMHTRITLEDLIETADYQKLEIKKYDIVLIRTGIFNLFFNEGPESFYKDFAEPGINYDENLIRWFYEMEISVFGTDTLGNEMIPCPETGIYNAMHAALSRNLGIVFIEAHWLEQWAEDCEKDGKYNGLYVASPLMIHWATASPVNPVVIK